MLIDWLMCLIFFPRTRKVGVHFFFYKKFPPPMTDGDHMEISYSLQILTRSEKYIRLGSINVESAVVRILSAHAVRMEFIWCITPPVPFRKSCIINSTSVTLPPGLAAFCFSISCIYPSICFLRHLGQCISYHHILGE